MFYCRYVRQVFGFELPCEIQIYRWTTKFHTIPGISEPALDQLSNMVRPDKDIYVSFVFDEMSIHKHITFDGTKFTGNEDLGGGKVKNKAAREALVMMVVAVNGSWKLPVSYFFINSLTAQGKR